jgi:hypothetical protein
LRKATETGRCVYWTHLPDVDAVATELAIHRRANDLEATLPPGVLHTVMQLANPQRMVVHLANYAQHVSTACVLSTSRHVRSYRLLTPDAEKPSVVLARDGAITTLTVPQVKIYSVLVIEFQG